MDDLLKQFLSDGEKLMENVPLDFFENYGGEDGSQPNGIHIVWFIGWARASGHLASDFNAAINDYLKSGAQGDKSLRDFCAEYTQGSLKPEHFSENARAFARSYYTTGWEHRYLLDLEALFPSVECFNRLVGVPENYEAVSRIISKRFAEFKAAT